jgi:hypothetical protein
VQWPERDILVSGGFCHEVILRNRFTRHWTANRLPAGADAVSWHLGFFQEDRRHDIDSRQHRRGDDVLVISWIRRQKADDEAMAASVATRCTAGLSTSKVMMQYLASIGRAVAEMPVEPSQNRMPSRALGVRSGEDSRTWDGVS